MVRVKRAQMLCSSLNVNGLLTSPERFLQFFLPINFFLVNTFFEFFLKLISNIKKNALKTTSLAVLVP